MEEVFLTIDKSVEDIHESIKGWLTKLEFINYEINFIRNDLLNSISFDPYTEDLFNTHAFLENKMGDLKVKSEILIEEIKAHDNKIGGILECVGTECDIIYRDSHQVLREQYEVFEAYYMKSKKELISYALKILKYKKNSFLIRFKKSIK